MLFVVQLLFLLLAVLWLLSCFLPNWEPPVVITARSVVKCVVGLLVLAIVFLIVMALFGAMPALPR